MVPFERGLNGRIYFLSSRGLAQGCVWGGEGWAYLFFTLSFSFDLSIVAGGGGSGWTEESFASPSIRGQIPIDPSSTLLVAGSLFVGSGLGIKKAPTVSSGKSAKEMLKQIMEEHRSSN